MPATVLYLNTDPLACIPQMTLAGMRRYAASRGWAAGDQRTSRRKGKSGRPSEAR